MNEFCVHCGILLPIKSVNNNTSLCNVCQRESKLREDFADYIKRKCDCDYCARSDETNVLKQIHSPAEECIENVAEHVTINKNNYNSNRPNFYHDVHDDELCGQSENRLNEQRQRFEFKAHTSEQVDKATDELDKNYLTIESRQTEDGNKLREDIEQEWKIEQLHLKEQLILQDTPDITALVSDGNRRKPDGSRYYVGGVDISFIKDNSVDACACLCVVRMPDLEAVYEKMEMVQLSQPYIPGFLAFREVPSLLKLLGDLKAKAPQYFPDVILLDGNGILHPRGFGLACQLGVLAQVPTVGVAKTLISAQGINEDQKHKNKKLELKEAGDGFELISDTGEILGMCLRAHDKATNPVYVSAGHMISLKSAVWLTLECSKYRIPEPIRRADIDSREYIRQGKKEPYEFIAD